jgi:hypothetical protein
MVGTKRQILSTRTAAPELCLGHHLDTAAAKIDKSLIYLALPRGLRQPSRNNHLVESGTPNHSTGSFGFLPRVSHQDATREIRSPNCASPLTLIITPALRSPGRYQARLDGGDRVLCVSRTPFFDAARKLVAGGYDPNLTLILCHAGSDTESLRAELGTAASLTVEETEYGPKLRRWKPISTLAVAPRIAPRALAATTLAD